MENFERTANGTGLPQQTVNTTATNLYAGGLAIALSGLVIQLSGLAVDATRYLLYQPPSLDVLVSDHTIPIGRVVSLLGLAAMAAGFAYSCVRR